MGELQPLLRVEHLSVEFKKFKALTDVNLTVNKGEVRVVIGPNGAGKSTLMDLICGRRSQPPARCSLTAWTSPARSPTTSRRSTE